MIKLEQLSNVRWSMFQNRKDAGEKLAEALEKYKAENPLILAIPRGGVEVGLQIARNLKYIFPSSLQRNCLFRITLKPGLGQ